MTEDRRRVRYLASPCCGAPVLGLVDVTVHPRLREDGTWGPIVDAIKEIRYQASTSDVPDGTHCSECGGPVIV